MDFDFTEEQVKFREKAREFAEREFSSEVARKFDREEKYPEEIRKKAYAEHVIDYSDPWKVLIAIEELCRQDAGLGISATVPYFGEEVIMLFGSDHLKEKYLQSVNEGKSLMGLAVTEPGGGSDVAGLKTTARKEGKNYIINGAKMFITNGSIADFFVMLVRTSEEEKRHHGLSAFVVESRFPGFKANKLKGKLGVRATDTAELELNNVVVPEENLIGEEGKGFYYIMTFFNISRIFVAGQGIGIAQGAFDRALSILRRKGKAYSEKEEIQFAVAEMATQIQAARLITYKAASYLFNFKPDPTITSMAKKYAAETAVFVAEKALEVTGVDGISSDLERFYRDAKILEIWEGTSEVEKLIISRNILKEAQ